MERDIAPPALDYGMQDPVHRRPTLTTVRSNSVRSRRSARGPMIPTSPTSPINSPMSPTSPMSFRNQPFGNSGFQPQEENIAEEPASQMQTDTTDEEKEEFFPEEGPDGGFTGWLQVFAAFLLVFNGFGFITSFGTFQLSYKITLGEKPSTISWIGSMQIFLLFLLGTVSGRLIDAGYFRPTLVVGFCLQLGGVFAASFASQFWQLLLSQGIAVGLGNGMHFTALVWLVSQYFTKKRGFALGISSCGAPIGAVIFTVIARTMITSVGIPWTLRTMGFLMLFNAVMVVLVARPKEATRSTGPLLELSAFTELPYLLFTIGMFSALMGAYFATYYVPSYSSDVLKLSSDEAFNNLIIMSAVGVTGRLIPPYFADRSIKPLRCLVIFIFLSGINMFAWMGVNSPAGLIVWIIAYAFTINAVQTLFTAAMGEVTTDMSKLGIRIGMVFTVVSFACLIGQPIGGVLVVAGGGKYTYAQIFGGAVLMLGGFLVAVGKVKQVGFAEFWRI